MNFPTSLVCAALFGAVAISTTTHGAPGATTPDKMSIAPGFKVELLHSVPGETEGSWVAICPDPKGRLYVSDQYGVIYRVTPPPIGKSEPLKIEKVNAKIGDATGLLWAFDSLYVVVCTTGKYTSGLYRVQDTDGDDQLDAVEKLQSLDGRGDHGPHQVLLSPDGKSLTVLIGNHTKPVPNAQSLVPEVWKEDHLLPRMWDARGHAKGVLAPGGCIYRVSPDGKQWTLVSMGYRNQYDAAYNRFGDLFTYDSDMEWDMNTPWYRPTRLCMAASGSEFGWRSGTGKWPAYYPDSLPSIIDVGPGSPTGTVFGYGAKFPAKYQEALFICDWSYGKLYAVHLKPEGAAYKAELETFLQGQPLPLTDLVVNPADGALYITTGGRKVQSGFYRVTYTGSESTAPVTAKPEPTQEWVFRKNLESFHGKKDDQAIHLAWPFLEHKDRYVRYAARVALEHQDPKQWQNRALEEKEASRIINSMLALARVGDASLKGQMIDRLSNLLTTKLSEEQTLEALRALSVVFIRMGEPDDATRKKTIERLDPLFPAASRWVNSELAQMLVYLQAPSAAAKTMALLGEATTQEEQLDYVKTLRVLKTGWTPQLREEYFKWFHRAAGYRGGASFAGFVKNIRDEAVAGLSPEEKEALKPILETVPERKSPQEVLAEALGKRSFVKAWTVEELAKDAEAKLKGGRDFESGRKLFAGAGCIACHRFVGDGGAMGPDLTGSGGRYTPKDLLEAIIEPSKDVSDQYAPSVFTLEDGTEIVGRVVNLNNNNIQVNTDMFDPSQSVGVNAKKVKSIEPSKVSLMPPGLINTLTADEVYDLCAYLLSGGDASHAAFKK